MTIATVMRFYEMYNTANVDLLDDLLTPHYVGHVNGREIVGIEAAKSIIGGFMAAFGDAHYTVHDTVAAEDKIVTRWTATATHRGPFAGVEPTHKQVTMQGITIFQIADDQIVALWNAWDVFGLMQQLQA